MDGGAKLVLRKLAPHLGAEVSGVDLRQPVDDATFAAIDAALAEYGLLVFPGQLIDAGQQMAFGRRFGELSVHPFAPRDAGIPELIVFDNDASNAPYGTNCWHSDETFRLEPPMGTMLCSKVVPAVGGDTLFVSMGAGYDRLSPKMREIADGLEAIHDFLPFRPLFGNDQAGVLALHEFARQFPNPVHPVVRLHPVSGRKVLFVSPQFTTTIKGLSAHESRALLDLLFRQADIPEIQYRHRWVPNTLLFWDNRSVQHYASHDYYPQRRTLERVTIKGGRPAGPLGPSYFLGQDGAAAEPGFGGHKPY